VRRGEGRVVLALRKVAYLVGGDRVLAFWVRA
jgi:hypothetical protein